MIIGVPTPEALVAHVLRRCSLAPDAARVARFAQGAKDALAAADAAIDWALDAPAQAILPAQQPKDGWDAALAGWTTNLRSPDAGLHERMTWFWHGHFATSSDKVGSLRMLHAQQQVFRTHAMGSFATMLRQIVTDPAMMFYLDMAWSHVEAPNENMARELMELFTIGPGHYSEDDVKAGALALAGYEVDYDTAAVRKNPERSLGGEVVFLGRRGRLGVDEIVESVLGHEASAPTVASKVHHHLVGVVPTRGHAAELGAVFRSAGYQIRPLVEAIVRSPDFLRARMNRPKFPIEWWVGALNALTPFRADQEKNVNPWVLGELNQLPHRPPNVAGWPISTRWLASDQQVTRASYVRSLSWRMQPLAPPPGGDLLSSAITRCCLHEVTGRTRQVLSQAALATAGNADELTISRRLITAALLSPEFAIA
jgi:uncharacterized protein (DUF1800 family)